MSESKKKKVLIMMSTGKSNLGDELILREEVEFVRSHYGDAHITIATYDKKKHLIEASEGIRFIGYFPYKFLARLPQNIFAFFRNIIAIYSADILIIGGGTLLSDTGFKMQIWEWFLRIQTARMGGTLILFWGITLDVNVVSNKLALRKIFTRGDFIITRDTRTKELLEALEVPSVVMDDISFLYQATLSSDSGEKKKSVGISVQGGLLEGTEDTLPQIYDFLKESGYEPVFLVFSTEGDYIEDNDSMYIKRIMAGRTYNVTKTIQQTLDIYPHLYASIAMRYHAGVLSCVHESPCIHISYGAKSDELIGILEGEHLTIKPNELSLDIFRDMWHNLERRYSAEQERLRSRNAYIKNELKHQLETL